MAESRPTNDVIRRQKQRRRADYENVGIFTPPFNKGAATASSSSEETKKSNYTEQAKNKNEDSSNVKLDQSDQEAHKSVSEIIKQLNKTQEEERDTQGNPDDIEQGEYVHLITRKPVSDESTDSTDHIIPERPERQKQGHEKIHLQSIEDSDDLNEESERKKMLSGYENVTVEGDAVSVSVRGRLHSAPEVKYPYLNDEIETEESDTTSDSGSSYVTDSDFAESDFEDNDNQSDVSSVSGLSISSRHSVVASTFNTKAYDIVRELVRSEEAYVSKLHLIVRVFKLNVEILNRVLEDGLLPEDKVKIIFSNLDVIFNFHSLNLLPRLQNRLMWWPSNPGIGDVMKSCIPFLKLYLDYSENYQKAVALITEYTQKNKQFSSLVREIEVIPECRRLLVQQHLLNICQRPAFYQAILRDYMSSLEEEYMEKQEIKEALESLSTTTIQLDKAMCREERVKKLLETEKRLDGCGVLVKANREFIREGRIWLISPTSGKPKQQYLFVFSDVLLLCGCAGVTGKHKVKFQLQSDGMRVEQSQNITIPHTFHVKCRNKTVEFHTESHEANQQWIECLTRVVTNFTKWKLSDLPVGRIHNKEESTALGERAPTLVPLPATSMCMACGDQFGARRKRRHCMACGNVVCKGCSSWQIHIKYEISKLNHVCDECYFTLSMRSLQTNKDNWNTLNVKASEDCLISGYLSVSCDRGSHWKKLWFSLREGGVLYSFKAHQDISALSSLGINNMVIRKTEKSDKTRPYSFIITGNTNSYLSSETEEDRDRWIKALTAAMTPIASDC